MQSRCDADQYLPLDDHNRHSPLDDHHDDTHHHDDSPTPPPSGTHSAELGLYNNGTTASQLGVTVQVVSDSAYGPDLTTYAPSGAVAAEGKLLMLAVGALTPAQATEIGTILATTVSRML